MLKIYTMRATRNVAVSFNNNIRQDFATDDIIITTKTDYYQLLRLGFVLVAEYDLMPDEFVEKILGTSTQTEDKTDTSTPAQEPKDNTHSNADSNTDGKIEGEEDNTDENKTSDETNGADNKTPTKTNTDQKNNKKASK